MARAQTRSRKGLRRKRAATQDVLGDPPKPERIPARWRRHYRHLVRLRALMVSSRGELVKDAIEEQPAYSLHLGDAATDSFDRDFALSLISSEQDAVYEIDQALHRIRAGTYGTCELTGKRIEANRLDAIPWTRFSADAERQLEKEGVVHRARMSPPAPLSQGTEGDEPDNSDEEE